MALVGNLKDIKLPNLVQLNCMEHNTAKLTISYSGKFGFIYFQGGQVVHAEYDPDIAEKAFYRLLRLKEGQFKVESGIKPPVKSIQAHWNNLLLEGLHQIDSIDTREMPTEENTLMLLQNVKGVKNCAYFSPWGEIINGNKELSEIAVLSAFTILEVGLISDLIQKDQLNFISLLDNTRRILLTIKDNNIVYIEIDPKQQLEMILPFIQKALQ